MNKYLSRSFNELIKEEVAGFLDRNKSAFPEKDLFSIDLHCHDYNSNVPDELLGRILNVSETWLPTEKLLATLKKHGMDGLTITNHNNARSCFELLDKGVDILVGAEFSCMVPDYQVGIHVLTYGFSPEQESILNKLRKNIYSFLDYTLSNDLPTIWAHPLYHYKKSAGLSIDFFNKMALIFERFEVLNGQRDTWQNMLVKNWIQSLTEEKIDKLSEQFEIAPGRYCRDPYKKSMSGGSDSHMGIFSGLTGSRLYVPDLEEKRKITPLSVLALDSIRKGDIVAFGGHNNSEKMMITFLDYVCQIAINSKDPGLLRILLHNGETSQKITAFLAANGFAELRRHKVTMNFIGLFHDSLTGIEPHFTKRWMIPREYKPIFDQTRKMARTYQSNPVAMVDTYSDSINQIYNMLGDILNKRITDKLDKIKNKQKSGETDLNNVISNLELPGELRTYLGINKSNGNGGKPYPDVAGFLDGLSFPFLTSAVILSAHFTSAHVLYNNRPLLNDFSKSLGCLEHPKRMLWLSDSWGESTGVSLVLKTYLKEIRKNNLPVDIMICSGDLTDEDHLIVVKPHTEIEVPINRNLKIRIPNYLEIHHKFLDGEYDRVMCTTEGPMGLAALYLKNAYTVPAYFYLHTDWKVFSKKVLKLEKENQDRLIRLLRAFYKSFDSMFVLNSDHFNWMTDKKMGIRKSSVFLTALWPASHFFPRPSAKKLLLKIEKEQPVILFTGILSIEKGVLELPVLYKAVREKIPGIRIIIVGSGPAEEQLKTALPDAIYLGWIDQLELPAIYSSADLMILPSKTDTFSRVLLEAFSCSLPVIAYNSKSPKDIIENGVNGFLVSNPAEMVQKTLDFFADPQLQENMKKAATERSKIYTSDQIITKLMRDTGLMIPENPD
jgi:glycosyltransferase involved in cell wall biosynthesis